MSNVCVLVVDDNEDNLDLLHDLLDAEGYTVYRAGNGPQAIQIAAARLPDVIILDLMMPHMDGLAVFEVLKANPKTEHIPCILNTAYSDRSNLKDALQTGFKHILCKPLNRVRLISEIDKCLAEVRAGETGRGPHTEQGRSSGPAEARPRGLHPSAQTFDQVADIDRTIGPSTVLGKRLIEAANSRTQPGSMAIKSVPAAIIRLGMKACREIIQEHARKTGGDATDLESLVGAISPLVSELQEASDPENALLERLRQIENEYVSTSQLET